MAIFMLSPKQEADKTAQAQTNAEVQTPDASEAATKPGNEGSIIPRKEIDEKTLILDGPLSQIYTEALNQMYAKESYITDGSLMIVKSKTDKVTDVPPGEDYIYVVNGKQLEGGGFVDAFDKLVVAQEKYKRVAVCVEHDQVITPNVARLLDYSRRSGFRILGSRRRALESMNSTVKAWKQST